MTGWQAGQAGLGPPEDLAELEVVNESELVMGLGERYMAGNHQTRCTTLSTYCSISCQLTEKQTWQVLICEKA